MIFVQLNLLKLTNRKIETELKPHYCVYKMASFHLYHSKKATSAKTMVILKFRSTRVCKSIITCGCHRKTVRFHNGFWFASLHFVSVRCDLCMQQQIHNLLICLKTKCTVIITNANKRRQTKECQQSIVMMLNFIYYRLLFSQSSFHKLNNVSIDLWMISNWILYSLYSLHSTMAF